MLDVRTRDPNLRQRWRKKRIKLGASDTHWGLQTHSGRTHLVVGVLLQDLRAEFDAVVELATSEAAVGQEHGIHLRRASTKSNLLSIPSTIR